LSFGSGGASRHVTRDDRPRPVLDSPALDLSRYSPVIPDRSPRWSHRVRHLDRSARVAVPEVADLCGFDGNAFVGILSAQGWVLRSATARDLAASRVELDERWRVAIPIGVRHRLGLARSVVVSVSLDATRVVVWPATVLDAVLEAGA
jgi:hypothetical protein